MGLAADWGIKVIAVDIDGTLYPKRSLLLRLALSSLDCLPFALKYNSIRKRIRLEDGTEGTLSDFATLRRRECIMMYGSENKLPLFIRKEDRNFRRRWERSFRSIKEYPGMRKALEKASESYRLAVISDFPIGSKLAALGVEGLFEYIASSEDSGALKPSRIPFEVMLGAMNVRPEEVLYIGDSESKDIKGAKNAGLRAALISASSGKVYSKADLVFSTWEEFSSIVL